LPALGEDAIVRKLITHSYVGTGILTFSGSAALAKGKTYSGSGALAFSGTAATFLTKARLSTIRRTAEVGRAWVGAAEPAGYDIPPVAYSYTGSGTLNFSGTAGLAKGKVYTGSGTLHFSGAASTGPSATHAYTGSGTLQFSGTAALVKGKSYVGSGTLQFSGAADTLSIWGSIDQARLHQFPAPTASMLERAEQPYVLLHQFPAPQARLTLLV
jgi:hypothetical protein